MKRAFFIATNIPVLLTLPIWGGLVMVGTIIYGAICDEYERKKFREIITGEVSIWSKFF